MSEVEARDNSDLLKRYWLSGEGAAKVRWKTRGDYSRCVKHLRGKVRDPHGLCATYYHDVHGKWPGKRGHHLKPKALTAANDYTAAFRLDQEGITLDANAPQIRIYGIIGNDVTAQQVVEQLDALGGADVVVRINSRGGNVFEGVAILNVLRDYTGLVTTVVDGLAASAASFIAMGGDEVVMNRNAEMMIHGSHVQASGNISELRAAADNLERINANMASIYAERTGGSVDEWLSIMASETWYSAEEAVKAGLADRIEKVADVDGTAVAAMFDLTSFTYAGRANAPEPQLFVQPTHSSAAPVEAKDREEPAMATLNQGLAELLGVPADADDEAINKAVEAHKERLAAAETPPEPTPAPEPTPEDVTKVAAQFGLTVMDTAVRDQLVADAAAGAEARAQQVREANERVITDALGKGKISPASAGSWREALSVNAQQTIALLDTLPENRLPVAEIGHGVAREDAPEDIEKLGVFAAVTGTNFGKDA